MTVALPSLDVERELMARLAAEASRDAESDDGQAPTAAAPCIIGVDEVGRGAIAGPVVVGAAAATALDLAADSWPEGLRDSKLLSERRREAIVDACRAWLPVHATGAASAREIDVLGITTALALAAKRALAVLFELGVDVARSIMLLDGRHDWLSPALAEPLRVVTREKADRDCAVVSCASVIAKVERDRYMVRLARTLADDYGWVRNKGYGAPAHYAALERHGLTEHHRSTWIRVARAPAPKRAGRG